MKISNIFQSKDLFFFNWTNNKCYHPMALRRFAFLFDITESLITVLLHGYSNDEGVV